MIRSLVLAILFISVLPTIQAQVNTDLPILPKPAQISSEGNTIGLKKGISIIRNDELHEAVEFLVDILKSNKILVKTVDANAMRFGDLNLSLTIDSTLEDESYQLVTTERAISIEAGSYRGIIWGIQTLHQSILLSRETINGQRTIPSISISDQPAFAHRGLLLDCCRHFFSAETVMKYIDLLSFYKMNVLHWHLTEDQGWRIEIDAYPKLTEIGAWRTEKDGSRYGGFYTKTQIREIVSYAKQRGVTVIPEIELPGHAQAALAAYPQFSCKGADIEVVNDWGVFKEIYCAGNDSTFVFLETILDEVMALFPSEYIHIGGDEAPKFRWEHCDKCQKRMADENLINEHALQSYFITRIEKHLNANGRTLIGWDEILEGGLAPNAVLQSWRGMEHGLHAAEMDHKVIMSPTSHCYLDYGLDAIDLEKIYHFNPIPTELSAEKEHLIIGGECNMWTEHVPNDSVLDSRVFPRMIGLSATLWEGETKQPFDAFYKTLQHHYPILSAYGVQYGLEGVPASIKTFQNGNNSMVALSAGVPNLTLRYTYGNDEDKAYSEPFELDKSADLKIAAFKNEEPYGEPLIESLAYHKALGKPVAYTEQYSNWYTGGGDFALVDGMTGSLNFRDGHWQGFSGNDAEVTIDLGASQKIESLSAIFYQYNNAWIFFPNSIQLYLSKDGEKWDSSGSISPDISAKERGKHIFSAEIKPNSNTNYRYVRIVAENIKEVPDWHEAAGSEAWIFIDEIIVE